MHTYSEEEGAEAMYQTIAVEESLLRVGRYLEVNGYNVVGLEDINQADMLVISDESRYFSGRKNPNINIPFIDASGLSVHDVLIRVKSYFRLFSLSN